jgi:phage I-like protein
MEEVRISESHLFIIVPDSIVSQIIGKTTELGHWYLKHKIHKKLVSNLEECFEDIKLFYHWKYIVQETLIINLRYINNQYFFEIINIGDVWSDEESYVVNCLNHTLGI